MKNEKFVTKKQRDGPNILNFIYSARPRIVSCYTLGVSRVKYLSLLLLLPMLFACNSENNCEKQYLFTGVVTDENNEPLSNVSVHNNFLGPLTKTDENGKYELEMEETKVSFEGESIVFHKLNYLSYTSIPYTVDEAGADVCGPLLLKRDVVMESL